MTYYRGDSGSIKFANDSSAAGAVSSVRNWSLTVEKDQIESTVQGDAFRTYVGGLITASGTAEILWEGASSDTGDLLDDVVVQNDDADAKFELYLNDTKKISFTGLVTNGTYGITVGEITSATVSFRSTGTISMDV